MALSLRDIKRRMKSVKNTGQITRAMEAVSATKMRKAQGVAFAARPFAHTALDILEHLEGHISEAHWLLETRPRTRIGMVLFTSDKGLCGVLNGNVLKAFDRFAAAHPEWFASPDTVEIAAVGHWGAEALRRKGYRVLREFSDVGEAVDIKESREVSEWLLGAFREKRVDAVFAAYTNFISTLKQEAVVRDVLPVTIRDIEDIVEENISFKRSCDHFTSDVDRYHHEYVLEPSPDVVLESLLPALVETKVYHLLLEANASEHSARMIAMKNASDNARDLHHDLSLTYNKARQASITREIAEITGGAAALEG